MNEIEAKEQLRVIKEMLERARRSTAEFGVFFLVWGALLILGVLGNYALVVAERYGWIWLNWTLFPGMGVVFSCVYWARRDREAGTKTYASMAAGHLGIGCGAAFVLIGLVLPALKVYSWGAIAPLISVVWGTYLFAAGGIVDWALLRWCGALSWAAAIGMVFVGEQYRALAFIPLILIGFILPGLIMKSRHRRERAPR